MKSSTKSLLVAAVFCASSSASAAHPNDGSPMGMNVSPPVDFGTSVPWVDMFLWFRGWENASNGLAFAGSRIDSAGWIKGLSAGEVANVGHGSGTSGHYPGGNYTLTWEGDGDIACRGSSGTAATFVSYDAANRRAVVHVDSTQEWWGVSITRSNSANYVRNMHMIMPGFENSWRSDPWHPSYIKSLERFKTLRFMDWAGTNGSTVSKWSEMKTAVYRNQSQSDDYPNFGRGQVAPLWMIRLCNRIHADGWFCMPHAADDDLIRQYATLVRDSLAPDLKVYIEYSNEVWNFSFPQDWYATSMSKQLGLSEGPAEFYAVRSSQIWRIWDEVFGAQKGRLEKVLAWQQTSDGGAFENYMFPFLARKDLNPDNQQPTAIAMAPYFGDDEGSLPVRYDNVANKMADVMNIVLPAKKEQTRGLAAYARSKGLKLFAYEGGQSFAGAAYADAGTVTVTIAAERDPLMKAATLKYLRDWFEVGGGMFCYYGQCGLPNDYGYWGAMEYYNQPRAEAPKYDAILTLIEDSIGVVATKSIASRSLPKAALGTEMASYYSLNGRRLSVAKAPSSRTGLKAGAMSASPGLYVAKKGTRIDGLLFR